MQFIWKHFRHTVCISDETMIICHNFIEKIGMVIQINSIVRHNVCIDADFLFTHYIIVSIRVLEGSRELKNILVFVISLYKYDRFYPYQ